VTLCPVYTRQAMMCSLISPPPAGQPGRPRSKAHDVVDASKTLAERDHAEQIASFVMTQSELHHDTSCVRGDWQQQCGATPGDPPPPPPPPLLGAGRACAPACAPPLGATCAPLLGSEALLHVNGRQILPHGLGVEALPGWVHGLQGQAGRQARRVRRQLQPAAPPTPLPGGHRSRQAAGCCPQPSTLGAPMQRLPLGGTTGSERTACTPPRRHTP